VTLDPVDDSFLVVPAEGPTYKVGPRCANPFCARFAEHAHHMFRRSLMKGDVRWVKLPTGETFQNLVGLCPDCHDRVTGRIGGHKNAIRILPHEDGRSRFWWCACHGPEHAIEYELLAPIDPQPEVLSPGVEQPDASASPEPDSCPTCGQPRRRRSSPQVQSGEGRERRRRKSWTLLVPDDEEDGAAALDSLVEALAPVFHVEPDRGGRYYVVMPALVHALNDIPALIASLAGRG
jgi:hypothetical protein